MISDVLFTLQIHVLHKENKPFDQDDGDSDKIRFFFSSRNVRYTLIDDIQKNMWSGT